MQDVLFILGSNRNLVGGDVNLIVLNQVNELLHTAGDMETDSNVVVVGKSAYALIVIS